MSKKLNVALSSAEWSLLARHARSKPIAAKSDFAARHGVDVVLDLTLRDLQDIAADLAAADRTRMSAAERDGVEHLLSDVNGLLAQQDCRLAQGMPVNADKLLAMIPAARRSRYVNAIRMAKKVSIEWNYPSSPGAAALKCPKGCWIVDTFRGITATALPVPFDDYFAATAAANLLGVPFRYPEIHQERLERYGEKDVREREYKANPAAGAWLKQPITDAITFNNAAYVQHSDGSYFKVVYADRIKYFDGKILASLVQIDPQTREPIGRKKRDVNLADGSWTSVQQDYRKNPVSKDFYIYVDREGKMPVIKYQQTYIASHPFYVKYIDNHPVEYSGPSDVVAQQSPLDGQYKIYDYAIQKRVPISSVRQVLTGTEKYDETAKLDIHLLMTAAQPYLTYGPDYDRNIAAQYNRVKSLMDRGHSAASIEAEAKILKLRLDRILP